MKAISVLSIAIVLSTLLSCEEVIEVSPKEQSIQIAVDGMIVNKPGESFVLLSNTAAYFSNDDPAPVAGASVSIKDNHGNTVSFEETFTGRYVAPAEFEGMPGRTYFLDVRTNNSVLTSQSTMPDSMEISNLRLDLAPENHPYLQKGYHLYGTLSDDPAVPNYFKTERFVNGIRQLKTAHDLQVFDDFFFDGSDNVEGPLWHWANEEGDDFLLKKDDVITVKLYALDKPAYDYVKALKETPSQGGIYGKNPANLPSNIHGGLGIFHAAAITTSAAVVVE